MSYEMAITITWAILVYVFYKIGLKEGRDGAVEFVQEVIHIDKEGEIRPGKDKKGAWHPSSIMIGLVWMNNVFLNYGDKWHGKER